MMHSRALRTSQAGLGRVGRMMLTVVRRKETQTRLTRQRDFHVTHAAPLFLSRAWRFSIAGSSSTSTTAVFPKDSRLRHHHPPALCLRLPTMQPTRCLLKRSVWKGNAVSILLASSLLLPNVQFVPCSVFRSLAAPRLFMTDD